MASDQTTLNRWFRVVGALLMNLSLGSLYAWSFFVAPLEKEFGWNRAQTSWTFTIAIFVFGVSFVAAGRMQDKVGPFPVSIIGSITLGLAFVLASYTNSLTWAYATLGVILGFGNGFGYATPIPVLSKWFPDKRGLAVGLAVAGYGAGSALIGLPFVGPAMLKSIGWRGTFLTLGVVYFAATIIGAFLLKNPPTGWKPAGWVPATASKVAATTHDYTLGEMTKTRQFPLLWVAYCLGASAGLMTISQLIPFAKSIGLPAAAATMALLIGAVGNASGRIFSGWMSDGIGRLQTLRLMILISAIAMPIIGNVKDLTFAYVMIIVVYYCFGTILSVMPSTTADFFGTKNLGVNYGALFTAYAVAGIVGPMIGGYMFKTYNNYTVAFYAAGVLALIAFACMLFATKPQTVTAAETQAAAVPATPRA